MSRLQAAVFQVLEGFTLSDDVRKILEAAYHSDDTFAQGRAAGLQEAAKFVQKFETSDLFFTHLAQGIRALSPTPSDAGKDDARDAAPPEVPHGWKEVIETVRTRMENDTPSAYDNSGYREYAGAILDVVEDELSALSSLEVIGKGEKG